ncbi:MAG TPA: DNA recombination protein RmuC, partial [Actinomycetota bacterium]|nr:DNA recombination protein RmuC [Actinomycetota bacterium]
VGAAVGIALGLTVFALRRGASPSQGRLEARLEARLEVQAAELRRLADASSARDRQAEHLGDRLDGARRVLEELAVRERERRDQESEAWGVIRRLSTVLAGGSGRGRAGENVLRQHLAELPPDMLETDFRVNGKVVEFALRLPDGRRLPVDSKWPAVAELEALESAESAEREARGREVERVVALRAREVAQYLDPALTSPVAVAAVPDAAYAVLRKAHADAFARGVVIVPYSTALPVLLFLYSLVNHFADPGDVRSALARIAALLDAMEAVVENRFARAAAMIQNGTDELRSQLSKARGSVARAGAGGSLAPGEPPAAGERLRALR